MDCTCNHGQADPFAALPYRIKEETLKHPCFSSRAQHRYARMHLPVAPLCNISCNYCNRKYDCPNESRPGVASQVLAPEDAAHKYRHVYDKVQNLSVVGIAGPGDALANWHQTRRTVELIRQINPETLFCLSTNGLMLPRYAGDILNLGIRHITITINCIDPSIGAKIYGGVAYQGKRYMGAEGAELLIRNQQQGLAILAERGAVVKVNVVMIKGINDGHIPKIVQRVKELGAWITNIMPLIPAKGSPFAAYPQTSTRDLQMMRKICGAYLQQMHHCRQCRADAIGLLGEDRALEFSTEEISAFGEAENCSGAGIPNQGLYRIAVASKTGHLVDHHFGHATEFAIYQVDGENFVLLERRRVGRYCTGLEACDGVGFPKERVIEMVADCQAVVAMRIGYQAEQRLLARGIYGLSLYDTVTNALVRVTRKLGGKMVV